MLLTASVAALAILACRDITGLRPPELSSRSLNPSGLVVVSPANMHGWRFYDDQNSVTCGDPSSCRLVQGPAAPPAGSGSAELATTATADGKALILQDYVGTRFSDITELRYATYRQTADAGNNLAIALQLNADYDLSDQATGYQGRLVYEPYQGVGASGTVQQATWQTWDAKAGRWWGTKASVTRGGVPTTNPCVQATPCTWSELLSTFPNVGVHSTYGAVVLKAGSGWGSFRGNVDRLAIGVSGVTTTFDFELTDRGAVPLVPPDSTPMALFDSLGTVSGAPLPAGSFRRDIVIIAFHPGVQLAQRQAVLDSIGGILVGGSPYEAGGDGFYYVRVPGGTAASLFGAVRILHRLPQVAFGSWWSLSTPNDMLYRKPTDGPDGWRDWRVDPATIDATRSNWALEFVRGPMAWGCSVGGLANHVAIVDDFFAMNNNVKGNIEREASVLMDSLDVSWDHATRVASIMAAVGNDEFGMTGMLWHTRLRVFDRFASRKHPGQRILLEEEPLVAGLTKSLIAAGASGEVSVINLSLGISWRILGRAYDVRDSTDSATVREYKDAVTTAIEALQVKNRRPLIVIAAGNDGITANAAGTAAAKEDYPDQVLVVGGLDVTGKVWSYSNTGRLVDVYAPGVNVTQADRTDQLLRNESGTSFAAPLAAGVAGLLKDFDPSLTAADLVRLIRAGARSEDSVRKLDAYGALQQAARSPHAPLCGNRVYKSGNGIYAERAGGAEQIIDLPRQTADSGNANIDVYHGGKRVDLGFAEEYDWRPAPRGFTHAPTYQYSDTLLDGATYLSGFGLSHDYEIRAIPNGPFQYLMYETTATDSATLAFYGDSAPSGRLTLDRFTISRPTAQAVVGRVPVPTPDGHFAGYFADANWTYVGEWTQPSGAPVIAMAPDGTFMVAAVNFVTFGLTANQDFVACAPPGDYDMPPAQCATGTKRWASHHAEIYRIDLGTRTSRRLTSVAGTSIAWMALSENGRELVWQTVVSNSSIDVRYYFQADHVSYGMSYSTILSGQESCTGKNFEYRTFDPDAQAAAPLGASPILSQSVDDGCYADHSNLGGTIAPSRMPAIAGGVQMTPAPAAVQRAPAWRRAVHRMNQRSAPHR